MELGCLGIHEVSPLLPHITPTLIFKIKASTPFKCKYQIVLTTLLVFVDVSEDSIMANDSTMPSNPPVALVEEEKLEEASLDVNVSQRSRKEESFKKVVCTRVNPLAWDHRLFFNPHALVICLKFVHARGLTLEGFEEC